MEYLCLVHVDGDEVFPRMSEAESRTLDIESLAYDKILAEGGHLIAARALDHPRAAALVRMRDGKMSATDGPFAETKEYLGGFILIRARDLNEAMRLAAGIPMAKYGTIEVRPIHVIPTHDETA